MLSRIADALFWIGRYVERADQTARVLEVNLQSITEDPSLPVGPRCAAARQIFGGPAALPGADGPSVQDLSVQDLLDELATARANPSAIAGAFQTARENARGAREVVPTEVWEALNTTTLELPHRVGAAGMHRFFRWSKDRCAVVNGLIDTAMPRDEAWLFWCLGQQLERADMLARILQSHDAEDRSGAATVMLLRTCSAEEAYIRSYRGQVHARDAIAFLLLDQIFPRSVASCLGRIDSALDSLSRMHGHAFDRLGTEDAARRIVGRVGASLRFRPLDDVIDQLAEDMEQVQVATNAVSRAINHEYILPAE